MFVEVKSGDVRRSWHMIAEADDGPFIPSMACEAIIRQRLDGRRPPAGARAATGDIELADYEQLFAGRAIRTGTRELSAASAALTLYRRLLGEAYDRMPAPLRALHDLRTEMAVEGSATVTRGPGVLARLAAALVGFPHAGEEVAVRVDFRSENGIE